MATVYHQSTEPHTSTRSPFAFDRFCDALRAQAALLGTTLLDISHRPIAETIGCSAARIPEFMQRLEDRGQITREPFKNRYLIDVSPLIDHPDRSGVGDRSGVIDQGQTKTITLIDQGDRSGVANRALPQPDAENARPSRDRVENVCMESLVAAAESPDSAAAESSRARARHLLSELGADDTIITDALTARPDLTTGQIRDTWAHFQQRIRDNKVHPDAGAFFKAIRKGRLHAAPPDPASDWHGLAPPGDPDPPGETLHQAARRLLPDGASGHDFQFVLQQLAAGASDDAALSALAARGKRGGR